MKWVARSTYLLVFAVLLGVAWWALREDEPEVAAVVEAPPTPRKVERPPPLLLDEPEEPPVVAALPPVEPIAPAPTPTPFVPLPRPLKPGVDADALARDAALIETARGQVKTDPEAALRSLAELKKSPGAHLEDAELVRVEALLRLGRRDEAEKLGRKLTARDANVTRAVERLLTNVHPN